MEIEICTGCEIKMDDFYGLSLDNSKLVDYLIKHGVVPGSRNCLKCGSVMSLDRQRNMFRCFKRYWSAKPHKKKVSLHCGTFVSLNRGTLLHHCSIGIKKICVFIATWMLLSPNKDYIISEFDISRTTVEKWLHCLWNVCVHNLGSNIEKIGGVEKTVEIYEAKVVHQTCRCGKTVKGNWVFGLLEWDSKNCFLVVVDTKGTETLLSIIENNIKPGTTIISRCWRNYNCLLSDSYSQLCINNCLNFVHPGYGGGRGKGILGRWREVNSARGLSRFSNSEKLFHYHIAEFLFRYRYPVMLERIHNIFIAIGKSYHECDALVTLDDNKYSAGSLSD